MAEITKEQFLPTKGAGTVAKEGDVVTLPTGQYRYSAGKFNVLQETPAAQAPVSTKPETPIATPRYQTQAPVVPQIQSEDEIRKQLDAQLASSIGAIKQKYATLKQEQAQVGQQQLGRTRASAAASGLLGSTFGEAQLGTQEQANVQAQRLLEEQQATEESQARTGISETTRKRFLEERDYATQQADKTIAEREKVATQARANIGNLAMTSKFEELPTSTVEKLFTESGFDTPEEFKAFYDSSRLAATKKNVELKEMKDGSWKQFKTDPITGETTSVEVVKAPTEPIKLSQGETLVNPETGKVIAEGATKHSTAYQEWEDYKLTGGTMDFNAYQTMDANRKKSTTIVNMTPQEQNSTLNGMISYYKATGQLPSFPYGSAGIPLRQAFWTAVGTGGNMASEAVAKKATVAAQTSAMRAQQTQLAGSETSLKTLDNQLGLLDQYSDKVDRTGSPLINKYALFLKGQIGGDADTQAMQNIVKTASMEFAKIMSGSAASIAGATVSSAEDAEKLLNANLSPSQIKEVIKVMKQEGEFRLKNQKQTIQDIQNDMTGTITGGADNDPLGLR